MGLTIWCLQNLPNSTGSLTCVCDRSASVYTETTSVRRLSHQSGEGLWKDFAPFIWNQFPFSVRHFTSVSSFKSSLKSFLYWKTWKPFFFQNKQTFLQSYGPDTKTKWCIYSVVWLNSRIFYVRQTTMHRFTASFYSKPHTQGAYVFSYDQSPVLWLNNLGWSGYRNKSQHWTFTPEKPENILTKIGCGILRFSLPVFVLFLFFL